MGIKQGDCVIPGDKSYSMYIDDNRASASYGLPIAYWGYVANTAHKRTYKVVATNLRNLPSVHSFPTPGIRYENDTIIKDLETGDLIFIQARFLMVIHVCPQCGHVKTSPD